MKRPSKPKPPALPLFPAGTQWQFTILGAPRTKKTHQRIARKADGTPFIIGAKTSVGWEQSAIAQLRSQWHRPGAINQPVCVRALFYRERATGDATNFYQAVGDALQESWVLMNDSLIEHWDGSRLRKDAANPRVVVDVVTL